MDERTIFLNALEKDDPRQRAEYLDQACGEDRQLRRQVEALLRASRDAGSFLEEPPPGLVATIAPGPLDTWDDEGGGMSLDFLTPCDKPGCLGKLGPYEVVELVGRGGMGLVLRAFDPKLNRVVAVKVMAPELAANPMAVKRFLREARAAAAVSHDHVVTIYAINDSHRPPYIVMEFVDGQSLQQKIDRVGALETQEVLRIGMQTARGLAAAHQQGLVHRDIKPANILLENGVERVKITDFGLARAADDVGFTQTGQITGTPQYMSPEQAQGQPVDARSDLFSLGSVLYTLCVGRPAFRGDSAIAVLRRVCDDDPRPLHELNPEIPDWLEAIIDKLMAKEPDDRFQSAEEVAELLGAHLAHLQHPTVAPRPAWVAAPLRPGRRDRRRVGRSEPGPSWMRWIFPVAAILATGLFLMGLVALFLIAFWMRMPQGTNWGGASGAGAAMRSVAASPRDEERLSLAEVRRFEGHTGTVSSVDVSADGKYALSCSGWPDADASLRLWDLATGKLIREFQGHEGQIIRARFSPDGRRIISGGADQTARIWDVETGQEIKRYYGDQRAWIHGVAITHDGTRALIDKGIGGLIELRDLATDEVLATLDQGKGRTLALAVSPDGRRALTGRENEIVVWSLDDARRLQTLKGHTGYVQSIAFFADGRRAVTASLDQTIRVWDVETGREIRRFEGHDGGALSARLTPDERFIVSGGHDGAVRVWEVNTGREVARAEAPHSVWSVAVTPDGRHVLSGGGNKGSDLGAARDFALRLWRLPESIWPKSGVERLVEDRRLEGHTDHVSSLSFGQTAERLLSASADGTVRLWDTATGQVEQVLPGHASGAEVLAGLHPDGAQAAACDREGKLRLWDLAAGEAKTIDAHEEGVLALAYSLDGRRVLTAGMDQVARLWDAETGERLGEFDQHGGWITDAAFSPDGRLAATASHDHTVRIWDTETQDQKQEFQHTDLVMAVAFAPDGKRVATACRDRVIRVFDVEAGALLFELKGHTDRPRDVAFSPDGRWLASSAWDCTIRLWDATAGRQIAEARHQRRVFNTLAFSPDSQWLASAGGVWKPQEETNQWVPENDYAIRVWRLPDRGR